MNFSQNSLASFPGIYYSNYIKLFSILKLSFKSSNVYDNNVYRGVGLWLNKCILYRPIYIRCVGTCISVYRPIVPNTRRLGGQTNCSGIGIRFVCL